MKKNIVRVVTKDEIYTRQTRNALAALLAISIFYKGVASLFGGIPIDITWMGMWSLHFAMLLHTHLKLKRIIRETYITIDDQ